MMSLDVKDQSLIWQRVEVTNTVRETLPIWWVYIFLMRFWCHYIWLTHVRMCLRCQICFYKMKKVSFWIHFLHQRSTQSSTQSCCRAISYRGSRVQCLSLKQKVTECNGDQIWDLSDSISMDLLTLTTVNSPVTTMNIGYIDTKSFTKCLFIYFFFCICYFPELVSLICHFSLFKTRVHISCCLWTLYSLNEGS